MKLLSAACLLATGCACPALAQSLPLQCMDERQMLAMLGSQKYREREALNAMTKVDGVRTILEVWSGATSSSIVLVFPNGLNCLLANGERWRWVRQPPVMTGEGG